MQVGNVFLAEVYYMRVYISSHDPEAARQAAAALEDAGHTVVSTWHLPNAPGSAGVADDLRRDKARSNAHQIGLCDVLVLVASAERVPGGKFVEAGIAIGRGKRVVVWGDRENLLLHHPAVTAAAAIETVVEMVGRKAQ